MDSRFFETDGSSSTKEENRPTNKLVTILYICSVKVLLVFLIFVSNGAP